MPINPEQIKNILVLRNDRFGEFLLNIPALRALKESFANAKIIAIVNPYVKDLAESIPFIDEVISWGKKKYTLAQKIHLITILRRRNIDIAIMLNPSKEFNIFAYLAGIPIRVGYDRKWGFLLTHKIKDKKHLGEKHEVEYNLELVGLVGAKTEDKTLSLRLDENINNELFENLGIGHYGSLVALHPWTSDPIKQWPIENFCALTRRLLRDSDAKVVIIGGKDELNKSLEYFSDFGGNLINITGRTSLKQLAILLKNCKLLISGDSGPVHLAACVGTPVIAIFRSDMPAKSAIRWGPCSKGSIVVQKDNVADISVEEVFNEVKLKT